MVLPKTKRALLNQMFNIVAQFSSNEKSKLRNRLDISKIKAKECHKWLAQWKQELDVIRSDQIDWQKELHDRDFLNQL